jgi:hypothetical protein
VVALKFRVPTGRGAAVSNGPTVSGDHPSFQFCAFTLFFTSFTMTSTSSDVLQRLLACSEMDLRVDTKEKGASSTKSVLSLKSKHHNNKRPGKACSEDHIVQAHIRSLLTMDRKLAARASTSAGASLARTKKSMKRPKPSSSSKTSVEVMVFGRTAAAQAKTHNLPEPTYDKKRDRKEKKAKQLRDIAKLLKKGMK